MKNKKLFLIANMYPSKKAVSFGIFVKSIYESLQKTDFKVKKSTIPLARKKIIKLFLYLKFYVKNIFVANFGNYDIFYIHFIKYSTFFIIRALKRRNKKIALHVHGSDIMEEGRFKDFFYKSNSLAIKNADKIIVPSPYYRDKVSKKYNVSLDKFFVSPSGGIDFNKFYPKPNETKLLKEKYSLGNTFVLGYVSQISYEKGFNILVDAFLELENKIPNLSLVVVGRKTDYQELEELLETKPNIKYLSEINHSELVNIYNLFDLFIFPTKRESLGLVGLEALACEVPVIASNIGGIRSYLTDELNGYLFKPGDSEDLAKKILKYYNNQDKFSNLRESIKDFESNKVIEELINKLNKL